MVAVLAAFNFSLESTKNATAEPPRLVGLTAELNSQIKISSMDFFQLKNWSDKWRILQAYPMWRIDSAKTAKKSQKTVVEVH